MSCKQFRKWGWLYQSDELSEKRKAKFETHLRKCSECRTQLDEVQRTMNACKQLSDEEPSKRVLDAVISAARDEIERKASGRAATIPNIGPWRWLPIGAAALVVVFFAAIHIGTQWNETAIQDAEIHSLEWENGVDMKLAEVRNSIEEMKPSITLLDDYKDETFFACRYDISSKLEQARDTVDDLTYMPTSFGSFKQEARRNNPTSPLEKRINHTDRAVTRLQSKWSGKII